MERKPDMKKSLFWFAVAALATLVLSGTRASADPIQWSFTALPITDASGNAYPGGNLPSSTSPLSTIQFQPASGNVSGSSGIIIYNLKTQSQQSSATPDSFNNVDFLASFNVTDTAANVPGNPFGSAVVTFHGQYNATNVSAGSLTKGAINWVNDQGNTSATQASVVLGTPGNTQTFTFSINPGDFLSSQAPGGGVGSFAVEATVANGGSLPSGGSGSGEGSGGGGGTVSAAPEPASLVLAGLGLPLFVLLRRRMKKAQAEANIA
jgi:hypothetical protein